MTIKRITNLSQMPKDKWLKPIPCPKTFKEIRRLHRDQTKTIYCYERRYTKFPPLVFLEQEPEPAPQPEPKPEPVVLEQLTLLPLE